MWFGDNVSYFDSFVHEYVPKEIKNVIGRKNITTNIYRIQAHDLIMCGCFCTWFIDFILKVKKLLDYTNLISTNEYEKNGKIVMFSVAGK